MEAEPHPDDPLRAQLESALGDRYKILRLLGRGGMGAVYLAREESLERLVAIKALRGGEDPSPEVRERFRREAKTAASLTHPNIVPLHAFGEVGSFMYLVMGYVRGEPLSARLRRDARLPADEARRIVADVAEALDYAHRQGVVHRDVKPDNILIEDETGRALLTDFGIAKAWSAGPTMTQAGGILGTPYYMSPEQASGQATIDGRTDLYALGVVAYAMLAGSLPFDGRTPQEILVKHLTQEPRPLREVAPDVPEDLAAAVMRCLAKDRAARWPDGRSLREAVARSVEAEDLPEPLDALDGVGPTLLPFLVALAYGFAYAALAERGELVTLAAVLIAGGIVYQLPVLSSAARLALRRGFTKGDVLRALLRQPRWWLCLWYPRRFRRPGDPWTRLPLPFRVWRVLVTVFVLDMLCVLNFVLILKPFFAGRVPGRPPATDYQRFIEHHFFWIAYPILSVLVSIPFVAVAALVTLASCARFMRSRGLDTYTLRRVSRVLLTGSTADAAQWKRPEVAALLLPPPGRRAASEPRLPKEYGEAIVQAAAALTGPAREAGSEASAGARQALSLLATLDKEIDRLTRESDPAEADRLRERLAALAGAEDGEDRQMRELIAQQLDLLERRERRLTSSRARRDRIIEVLRQLWRSIGELSARPESGEAAARLRALCAEIAVDGLTSSGVEEQPTRER